MVSKDCQKQSNSENPKKLHVIILMARVQESLRPSIGAAKLPHQQKISDPEKCHKLRGLFGVKILWNLGLEKKQ